MLTLTRETPSAVALREFLGRYEKVEPVLEEAVRIISAFGVDLIREERERCAKLVELSASHWRRSKTNCNCYIDLGIVADNIRNQPE